MSPKSGAWRILAAMLALAVAACAAPVRSEGGIGVSRVFANVRGVT
ncbi:MAG: hypothetical protein ACT4P5_23370 [Armatimonadota bacterium]